MFRGLVAACILATLTTVQIVECTARHGNYEKPHKTISCYECNSEYDPRCADPFDPYTIGQVNCSKKRPLDHMKMEPILCRKTIQKVQGHIRVIRGCGYIPDERDDKECVKRSGTHDVQVLYCSCKSNLCNAGHLGPRPIFSIVLGAIILAITPFMA